MRILLEVSLILHAVGKIRLFSFASFLQNLATFSSFINGEMKEDYKEKDARDQGDSIKLPSLVSQAQGDLKTYAIPPDLIHCMMTPVCWDFRVSIQKTRQGTWAVVSEESVAENRARGQYAKDGIMRSHI
jgi:hypothetical protein